MTKERRLGSDGRRLAGSIEFGYRVQVESQAAAEAFAEQMNQLEATEFTNMILEQLPEDYDISITVLSISAEAVSVTVTTTADATVEDESEEPVDSHTRPSEALGPAVAALIVATITFSQ